jgi:cellulose synthase/poly-beta-1,6-N-acetylglucosamine synthase-like glycosyltransferase
MPAPALSVLLPARDAAATLAEALEGVLAQEGAPPFEVVCVDDGSTDRTPAVLAQYAARDPRVRLVRGAARGLVAALQLGLSHCRAPLIARMDADDLVHPARLRLQAGFLTANPAVGAVGSLVRLVPGPLTPGLARLEAWLDSCVTPEECALARFVEAPLVHPSITFRRSALDVVGGFQDRGWAEDWDLLLRLAQAGYGLAKVPEVLLWWRDSPSRLTRTGPAYRPGQMVLLRAHHLAQGPLRGRPFDLWGAGPTGKKLLRALEPHGLRPRRVIDIDPRKQVARGVPITQASQVGPPDGALVLCAVGAAGARETIRAALLPLGYREGPDFLFAA